VTAQPAAFYADKIDMLRDIFGAKTIEIGADRLTLDGTSFPIIDDVIIALDPGRYPDNVRQKLNRSESGNAPAVGAFSKDIQRSFGAEWLQFEEIMPEHEGEFRQYFDGVDLQELSGARVCDLGCGMGRWSYFLKDSVRELVLVDFSEAIFVARQNLRSADNAVFVMADVTQLPFRSDFADFAFCLGVLHHLPLNALQQVRQLSRFAPRLLIYLYSALDSRPRFHRVLLGGVDAVRKTVSKVENPGFRTVFTWAATFGLYLPMIGLGALIRPLGLANKVPLYEFYHGKSLNRIRQDVYDRFFTSIEQRFSRQEILEMTDTFSTISVSDQLPLWHFLCERGDQP
jgi:SAM-dependent methyltransferase